MTTIKEKYVPILKTKEGERWSLENLFPATKKRIMPLLELIPIPKPRKSKKTGKIKPAISLSDHVSNQCDYLVMSWGTSQPFYLDTKWLHGSHGDPAITKLVFDMARSRGLQAIPVAYPGLTAASLAEIKSVATTDGRGCLIRADRGSIETHGVIPVVATAIGLPPANMDFLIDYRSVSMSLASDVSRIPFLHDWRELIAASGSFPRSIKKEPAATWNVLDRTCWDSWRSAVTSGSLPRLPLFSDYGVKDHGSPAGGGDPPVMLRYTVDSNWLVRREGTLHGGNSVNMISMCKSLIARPEYIACGPNYSAGDLEISNIASGTPGTPTARTGNPGQWVQWSISHHLEFVVKDQITRLP
jgi:hypothetical protein